MRVKSDFWTEEDQAAPEELKELEVRALECLAGVPGMRPAHSRVLFSHAQEAIAEEDEALDWDQVLGSVVGDEEVPFDSDEDEVSGEDEDEVSGEDEDEEEEAEGKEEEEAEGEEEEVVIVQERKRAREESAKPTDVRKAKARKVEPAKQGGRPKQQKRKRNEDDEVQKTPVKVPCHAPAPLQGSIRNMTASAPCSHVTCRRRA